MAITSLSEFITYVKQELGSPVITVELADVQITQIIENSIQDFNRYNYGEGLYKDYMTLSLVSGQADYSLSGNDVEDVIDLLLSGGITGGINTLFTPTNMLLSYESLVGAQNFGLANYYTAMTGLKELYNTFGVQYRVDYIPAQSVLRVVPTPSTASVGMLEVYKRETAINLYNHILVKRLTVGRCMMLWGRHLLKYNVQFPGGGTVNGSEIKEDGKVMEEKALDDLRAESEPPMFEVG